MTTPPTVRRPAAAARAVALVAAGALVAVATAGLAADIEDDCEGPATTWSVAESDAGPRVRAHGRTGGAHRGAACERIQLQAGAGTTLRVQTPIGRLAVIDELRAGVWVKSTRPDVRLSLRVVLPDHVSRKTGRPVETLVPGTSSNDADRWMLLEVDRVADRLASQLPALQLEHGPGAGVTNAVATHLVLDCYTGPGDYDLAVDDLLVRGAVAVDGSAARGQAVSPQSDPLVQPAAATVAEPAAEPEAGLDGGHIQVAGLPFFPRSIEYNGEPLATLAALGFNCVHLGEPATGDLLEEARQAGLWVICPPPPIPDIDVRDPESRPMLRHWDRVLMWDLGRGLGAADIESLAERGRRVRACDPRNGRPLIASADSSLRDVSRHVDLLVAGRAVLGTSLELLDYATWLRERPRLARPGTPFLAGLSTEIDPRAARQAAAIAGVGGRGLAADPESLSLATLSAVAAGARGLLCASSMRIDGGDHESRKRAAAVREMNLRLKLIEPWAASGRFAVQLQTSDGEVQAVVIEAARARLVLAWRCVQGSQIVARRYGGGDLPSPTDTPLTLLVSGVPEAHQAWEIAAGGLKPLRQRRATGGVAVTIDSFMTHACVLVSGDPSVTGYVQERLRELAPMELASARALAGVALADAAELLGRLPPQALSGPPPVDAGGMLSTANRLAIEGETLAAREPGEAVARLRRAAAIAGQFERRIWENGVKADGSMVASPLVASDAALAEHWRFVEARSAAAAGAELLPGGGMDRIEDLAGNGWRHFAQELPGIVTAVEVVKTEAASGSGCLRLSAKPTDAAAPPVVVETPPVWVTTPPIDAPAGRLLEITAQVRVRKPINGSVDGLLVFDSLGGPALAERVGTTKSWRRLVLYRIVPPDEAGTPLSVTFALTGVGDAEIDGVSIRPLERMAAGAVVATPAAPAAGGFPGPGELLAAPTPPPPAAVATTTTGTASTTAGSSAAAPQWPGMNLEWPRLLPFGQSATAPPPGPGGGTIDPFKRARATTP